MSIKKSYFIDCGEFYFRALTAEDLNGTWPDWFNDPVTTRFQNKGYFPNTKEKQTAYFDQLLSSNTDVVFALVEKQSNVHFGNVGLHAIDWLHRTAILGIIIGLREYQGRGWGHVSWKKLTDYAFRTLNMEKVNATVLEGNDSSRRCAEASGYLVEGKQRAQFFKNGIRIDALLMGLTREDWESRTDDQI